MLCTATIDDDFEEGEILVVIKKAHSEVNKPFPPEDSPETECTAADDLFGAMAMLSGNSGGRSAEKGMKTITPHFHKNSSFGF